MKMRIMNLRLTEKLYSNLKTEATKRDISVSELMRESIRHQLYKPCSRCDGNGTEPTE